MELFSCLHPVKVRNRFTNQLEYVPCGKCDACRLHHSAAWTYRLQQEQSCHFTTIFFTLSYSNKYIKKAWFHNDAYFSEFNNYTPETFLFDLRNADEYKRLTEFDSKDWAYINKRKCIYYPDYELIRKFMKRLRSKLLYAYKKGYETDFKRTFIRAFISTEYGPNTLRPHHHGLLFVDSKWFAENAEILISQAWSSDSRVSGSESYGRVDVQFASNAASYVSQYINCVNSYPKIYSYKLFRPKCYISRRPPIGSLVHDDEEIRQIFLESRPFRALYDRSTSRFKCVPLSDSLESKLFPKIQGFMQLNDSERIELYRFCERKKLNSFESFSHYVHVYCIRYPQSWIANYFGRFVPFDTSLSRFYGVLCRVNNLCLRFNLDISSVVHLISQYYYNKEQMKLKEWYVTRQDGSLEPTVILSDKVLMDKVHKSHLVPINLSFINQLGVSDVSIDSFTYFDLSQDINFMSFKSRVEHAVRENIKTHKRNSYCEKRRGSYPLLDLINNLYGK